MVGDRGFEPPTPWSRTGCVDFSDQLGIKYLQAVWNEWVCCDLLISFDGSKSLSLDRYDFDYICRPPVKSLPDGTNGEPRLSMMVFLRKLSQKFCHRLRWACEFVRIRR
jgi:hypothetical protein